MTTDARIHANRLNAQRSTGPRTPEGKARVALNAVKHGILCDLAVLPTEDRGEFEDFRDALVGDLAPLGAMEQVLAERIVSSSWRLRRVLYHETCIIDRDGGRALYHEHKMGLDDVRQPGDRVHPSAMGEALVESLTAPHSAYDTLRRYERPIQRDLEVCLRDLETLQGNRGTRERRAKRDAGRLAEQNCGLQIVDCRLGEKTGTGDRGPGNGKEGNREEGTGNRARDAGPEGTVPGSPSPGPRSPDPGPPAVVGFVSQGAQEPPPGGEAVTSSNGQGQGAQAPESGGPAANRQSSMDNGQSAVGFVSQAGDPASPGASPGQDWRGRGPRMPGDHIDEKGILRDITGREIPLETPAEDEKKNAQ